MPSSNSPNTSPLPLPILYDTRYAMMAPDLIEVCHGSGLQKHCTYTTNYKFMVPASPTYWKLNSNVSSSSYFSFKKASDKRPNDQQVYYGDAVNIVWGKKALGGKTSTTWGAGQSGETTFFIYGKTGMVMREGYAFGLQPSTEDFTLDWMNFQQQKTYNLLHGNPNPPCAPFYGKTLCYGVYRQTFIGHAVGQDGKVHMEGCATTADCQPPGICQQGQCVVPFSPASNGDDSDTNTSSSSRKLIIGVAVGAAILLLAALILSFVLKRKKQTGQQKMAMELLRLDRMQRS